MEIVLSILASESQNMRSFKLFGTILILENWMGEDNKTAEFQNPAFNFKLNTQQFKERLKFQIQPHIL